MSVTLHSYIHCHGNAREALQFYQSVFGGLVILKTFADYHMPVPESENEKIMHGVLKGDGGIGLMASDTPASMASGTESGKISLTLSGDDDATLRGYWEKLSDGAEITASLADSPWGDIFGMLTDKYGVEWMVDIRPVETDS